MMLMTDVWTEEARAAAILSRQHYASVKEHMEKAGLANALGNKGLSNSHASAANLHETSGQKYQEAAEFYKAGNKGAGDKKFYIAAVNAGYRAIKASAKLLTYDGGPGSGPQGGRLSSIEKLRNNWLLARGKLTEASRNALKSNNSPNDLKKYKEAVENHNASKEEYVNELLRRNTTDGVNRMSWQSRDAKAHTKLADSPKKMRRWAVVANGVMKKTGDNGKSLRAARASVEDRFWDSDRFLMEKFDVWLNGFLDGKKPEQIVDTSFSDGKKECPDCEGTGEDPNGDDDDECPTCGGSGEVGDDDDNEGQASDALRCSDYLSDDSQYDTEFSTEQRKEATEKGQAMPGGGFPIRNKEDLSHAKQALGRAKNRSATIRHIKTRAKALGVDLGNWPNDSAMDGATRTIRLYDRIEFEDAKVRTLENGYISAQPRIARTGIQLYGGDECGRDDMYAVRVYRPEAEVFHMDAIRSYTHVPVTLDHPKEPVTADNWKKYAVGETGDEVLRDGTAVRVPMMLRDSKAIKAFKEGTNQLSVGYDCDLEWIDGVTDDGEHYDAIQHGIRANHLAVVTAARGGSTLMIGDGNTEGDIAMNFKTILVDGLEVQVADGAAAVIQRTLTSLQDKLREMKDKFKKKEEDDEKNVDENQKKDAAIKKLTDSVAAKDKELETLNGQIAVLKTQVTDAEKKASPAAIDSAARERAGVINKALTLMGGKLKTDGMTVTDIRRSVVEARLQNCKDWSDDRISGAFDAMQNSNSFSQHEKTTDTTMEDTVRVFGRPGAGYQTPGEMRDKAYSDYDQSIGEAWRGGKQA